MSRLRGGRIDSAREAERVALRVLVHPFTPPLAADWRKAGPQTIDIAAIQCKLPGHHGHGIRKESLTLDSRRRWLSRQRAVAPQSVALWLRSYSGLATAAGAPKVVPAPLRDRYPLHLELSP